MTNVLSVFLPLALLSTLTAGCAAGIDPGTSDAVDDPDVVGVSLSLTVVQPDAVCHRATFTGATTYTTTFAPAVGSTAPVLLTRLPVGTFSLVVDAFNLACASVVATTPVTWTSTPINVTLSLGTIAPVTVTLKRPAASAIALDYDTSHIIEPAPSGASPVLDLAVLEPNVYVGRPTQIDRLPVLGGPVNGVTVAQADELTVSPLGLFYRSNAAAGTFWVPPGLPQMKISGFSITNLVPIATGVAGWIMAGTVGMIVKSEVPGGLLTTLMTAFPTPPLFAADATNVYYAWAPGAGQMNQVGKAPLAVGGQSILAFTPSTLQDITTDGVNVFVTHVASTLAGSTNAISRVGVSGTALTQVAAVTGGLPHKLLVDGANLYYTVKVLNNLAGCEKGFIYRMPKAGGAATALWSKSLECPTTLAVSAQFVLFNLGNAVHAVLK